MIFIVIFQKLQIFAAIPPKVHFKFASNLMETHLTINRPCTYYLLVCLRFDSCNEGVLFTAGVLETAQHEQWTACCFSVCPSSFLLSHF